MQHLKDSASSWSCVIEELEDRRIIKVGDVVEVDPLLCEHDI